MKSTMIPRQRMLAALDFQPVDMVPLQIYPSPAGIFEHGQKLIDLIRRCGHDFDDLSHLQMPNVPAEDFDPDGRYHKFVTDAWGTTWEYRIFGIWGHRKGYPLADISKLDTYRAPTIARLQGEELARARAAGEARRQRYFHVGGGISLFETIQSLRPFEDVLIDITLDTPEINRLADMVLDYYAVVVDNALAMDADAVAVGDDYGTQQALLMSPVVWRRFFKPRYQALLEPVVRAGKKILFHSCGCIGDILGGYPRRRRQRHLAAVAALRSPRAGATLPGSGPGRADAPQPRRSHAECDAAAGARLYPAPDGRVHAAGRRGMALFGGGPRLPLGQCGDHVRDGYGVAWCECQCNWPPGRRRSQGGAPRTKRIAL